MVKSSKMCFSLVLTFFCLFFFGCSKMVLEECQEKISDERMNYFEGETQDYFVSFSSGVRESPYYLDGKSEQKVEFGVVTIKPKNSEQTKYITYNVCVNNDEFVGEFEKSPFDDTYAGDISKRVFDDDVLLIKLNDGEKEQTASMTNVSSKFKINSKKALEIALEELKPEYQAMKDKNFEIYIKIVADITRKIDEKYYLVMFFAEDGKSLNVVINPMTGECEIKKI